MTKFKTITQEQLDDWAWDENHMFDIQLRVKHLIDWFNNIPSMDDDYEEYTFRKCNDETVLISYPARWWMCGEVDPDELDQAVLDRLHLKMEWIKQMPCNG